MQQLCRQRDGLQRSHSTLQVASSRSIHRTIWKAMRSCPISTQLILTPWAKYSAIRVPCVPAVSRKDTNPRRYAVIRHSYDTWLLLASVLRLYHSLLFLSVPQPLTSQQDNDSIVCQDAVGHSSCSCGVRAECCCPEYVAIRVLAARS
jgi:hypothetical protein